MIEHFVIIKGKEGNQKAKTGPYPSPFMAETMAQTYEAMYRVEGYTTEIKEEDNE